MQNNDPLICNSMTVTRDIFSVPSTFKVVTTFSWLGLYFTFYFTFNYNRVFPQCGSLKIWSEYFLHHCCFMALVLSQVFSEWDHIFLFHTNYNSFLMLITGNCIVLKQANSVVTSAYINMTLEIISNYIDSLSETLSMLLTVFSNPL